MARLAPLKPLKPRNVECIGGPWHGYRIETRIPMGCKSLVIRVKSDPRVWNRGRYKMGETTAKWEPVNVSIN